MEQRGSASKRRTLDLYYYYYIILVTIILSFLRESNMQYEIISELVNKLCLSLSSYLPIVMMEGCEEMHGGGGGRRRRGRREPFRGQK